MGPRATMTVEDLRRRLDAAYATARTRLRGPVALTLGAAFLVTVGVGSGVLIARRWTDERITPPIRGDGQTGSEAPARTDLERLRREVEAESSPTKKLLAFAHLALDEGQTPAAIWAYKRVLAREPRNVEAITHSGVILFQGNHVDQALARVEEALRIDPGYTHAHWDRAQLLFHGKKDYAAAARALEAFLTLVPTGEDAERARAMLAEARRPAAAGNARAVTGPPGTSVSTRR